MPTANPHTAVMSTAVQDNTAVDLEHCTAHLITQNWQTIKNYQTKNVCYPHYFHVSALSVAKLCYSFLEINEVVERYDIYCHIFYVTTSINTNAYVLIIN